MSYGSVLKDNENVNKQSKIYPYMNVKYNKEEIPDTFDGRSVWYDFIMSPEDNKEMSSWAIVARDVFNDRFCLGTSGQIIFNLDFYEMMSCIEKEPYKKSEGVYSTYGILEDNSSTGYSIFDAWEYIYKYGLFQLECFFSEQNLIEKKLKMPYEISYNEKIKIYGKKCFNINSRYNLSCNEKINGKPLAKHIFFPNSIYNVDAENKEDLIINIKYQIAKWGPVAAGFIVYENFRSYNGLDVYNKVEGKPIGAHYVSIVGWGSDYWICRNSRGADWGLLGYFKMKMNIKECQLENNVSCVLPYVYDFKPEYDEIEINDGKMYDGKVVTISDMKIINDEIYKIRMEQKINYEMFYSEDTIRLIKEGKVLGELRPLILYPEELPHPKLFWIKNIDSYDFVTIDKNNKKNGKNNGETNYFFILLCIISFYLGYKSK